MLFAQTLHYQIDNTGTEAMQTTITGVFMLDGEEIYNGEGMEDEGGGLIEIGVFDQDGICRGAKLPTWRIKSNQWYYQLKLRGYTGCTYPTFKVYDHATETELEYVLDIDETFVWTANGKYGSISNMYPINFTAPGITKDIAPNQWYLIASPVGDVNPTEVNNMLQNTYDLYYFDQKGDSEGKEWINRKINDTEINDFGLTIGQGYLYANSGVQGENTYTISFPGNAYSETETLDVPVYYYTDNADPNMCGWNLVGNPFNAQATIGDEPFYRMTGGALLADPSTDAIEPMEGVFVHTTTGGNVTFAQYEGSKSSSLALNLTEDGKVVDRAIVGFGQGKTLPRLQLNNNSKLYIPVDGKEYAVVRSEGMGEMPVSFKAESNGTYSLSLSTENIEFSYLHLIDNLTGADQDLLANPSYSFSANTTDYASRFRLVFATGSDENNFAFFSNGSLFVNNEGSAVLQVVDVTGRIVKSESINGSANVNFDAAPGVYMVRLVNGDNMKVQKVVK